MKSSVPWRNILRAAGGTLVALFLLKVVIGKQDLWGALRDCHIGWIGLAVLLMFIGVVLSSLRWSRLLRLQGVKITQSLCFRMTMIGTFWNMVIPGGVGGDVVKAVYIKAVAGPRSAEAMLSILVDRIVGLLGLFAVAIIAAVFCQPMLVHADHAIKNVVTTVTLIAAGAATALALATAHDLIERVPGIRHLIQLVGPRLPRAIVGIIGRVVDAMDVYRERGLEMALALAISMLIHSLTALSVAAIGEAFRAVHLQLRDYFLATGMANTIAAIPITPGGIGARDVVMQQFFQAAGEHGPASSLVPPVFSLVFVLLGLFGGLFYVYHLRHTSVPLE